MAEKKDTTEAVAVESLLRVIGVENFLPAQQDWRELDRPLLINYVERCISQLPELARKDKLILAGIYRMYDLHDLADVFVSDYVFELRACQEQYETKINN